MSLTTGTGPFSGQAAGRFDVSPPATPLLFWEPYPQRFRVVAGGKVLADSRRCLAVHQTGQMMRLGVPSSDVSREFLSPGKRKVDPQAGQLRSWSLLSDEVALNAVAESFEAPTPAAAQLKDYVCFDLDRVDAWYLEDELGYAHPRDPYHRFDVHRSSRSVIVRVGTTMIAECSTPAILFETSMAPRFYLPADAIREELLRRSDTVSECPYKGDGQHWHVLIAGERIADAAWNLTTPMGDALTIPRWFSFYPDKVDVLVDGELQKPDSIFK